MKKIFAPLLLTLNFFLQTSLFAQVGNENIQFFISDSLPFKHNGQIIIDPFTGGFSQPIISQGDINNDGKPDILIFDNEGRQFLTYINTGTSTNYSYTYAPQYEFVFSDIKANTFAMFRDFNRDGKQDLFTLENTVFRVYKNVTQPGDPYMKLQKMPDIDYRTMSSGEFAFARLGGRTLDFPIIDDIDGDGDLDYITFEPVWGNLKLFKNEQVERGFSNDTMVFRFVDFCWGGFREANDNDLFLNCNRQWFPRVNSVLTDEEWIQKIGPFINPDRRHLSGTTLFSIDMDNDGDKELIMGNGEFQNLLYVLNGKSDLGLNYDTMISYKSYFPSNDEHEIKMKYTPALFHFDVDGDGVKDLLAAPFFEEYISKENIWFLKNEGTDANPFFKVYSKNFFGDRTIDHGRQVGPVFWDIDEDGKVDLLLTVEPDTLFDPSITSARIYRYDNVGTTANPIFELVDTDFASFGSYNQVGITLAVGDLDLDGKKDLIVGNAAGRVLYIRNISTTSNTKTPTFSLMTNNLLGSSVGFFAAPTIFDYSRDGYPDLIVGKSDGFFAYYRNNATGATTPTFTKVTDELGKARTNFFNTNLTVPSFDPVGSSAPIFFDFDNDGKPELVSGSLSGHIKIWRISYNPDYEFPEVTNFYGIVNAGDDTSYSIKLGQSIKVAITRFTDTGKLEVLVGTRRGGIRYLSNNAASPRVNVPNVSKKAIPFNVYPNPNYGTFYVQLPIELKNRNLKLEIRDITGRLIYQKDWTEFDDNVKFEASKGIYVATITEFGSVVAHSKIIIE